MAEFEVKVVRIDDVIDHPNADRLTIVKIGGYRCIANKKEDGSWRYAAGDLVVYIPEQAVVPETTLKLIGFWDEEKGKGMLAGSKGDRVKAIKLRDVFSQGILVPVEKEVPEKAITNAVKFIGDDGEVHHQVVHEGMDVADLFGIIKYEPPIPTQMAGEVWNAAGKTIRYDVENIQKYPDVFKDGEYVVATEKLHGTWCCYGIHVSQVDGERISVVTSKGLSAKGLAFKFYEKNMRSNLYLQVLERSRDTEDEDILERLESWMFDNDVEEPVYLLGEIFGRGVQDLGYGEPVPVFRLFDVYVGQPGQGRYMGVEEKSVLAKELNIDTVPFLYRGPFSMEKMEELRDGQDFSGSNIREGIIILPLEEREDLELGRVQLKFVSPAYLLRKGGTEFN